MKFNTIAALAGFGLALSGCASIVKGTTQSVAIATPPTTGARCILSSKEGNWQVMSPGVAKVSKSKEDIQVTCSKAGWQEATATIPSKFQGWTLGNVVLGGGIGAGVDAATGAMNEYPGSFQIPMQPAAGSTPAAASYTLANAPPASAQSNPIEIASDPLGSLPPLQANQARIFFFREPRFVGAVVGTRIKLDGKIAGTVRNGTAIYVDHVPGDVLVGMGQSAGYEKGDFVLTLEPGKEYFVIVKPRIMPAVVGRFAAGAIDAVTKQRRCADWYCADVIEKSDAMPELAKLSVSGANPDAN